MSLGWVGLGEIVMARPGGICGAIEYGQPLSAEQCLNTTRNKRSEIRSIDKSIRHGL